MVTSSALSRNPLTLHPLFDRCPVRLLLAPAEEGSVAALLEEMPEAGHLLLVADVHTYAALGRRLSSLIPRRLQVTECLYPAPPYADADTVRQLAHRVKETGATGLLAVGSGTLNDLCKYTAFRLQLPYAVAATAPSMNGYLSANASISVDGHKQTLPAQLPKAILADISVLAAAPARLIRAGLGDSLCRPTAQADWLLSHMLLDTEYKEAPFGMLEPFEEALFAQSAQLMQGDEAAIGLLMQTLLASGYGMTIAGGSYPASQGEHLIAHAMEQRLAVAAPAALHGEAIGVTTLTMARLQERLLALESLPALQPLTLEAIRVSALFGGEATASIMAGFTEKRMEGERLAALQQRLARDWPEVRHRLRQVMRPAVALETVLKNAGAPTTAEALGWPTAAYQETAACAHWLRNRFTFLDLAAMTSQPVC